MDRGLEVIERQCVRCEQPGEFRVGRDGQQLLRCCAEHLAEVAVAVSYDAPIVYVPWYPAGHPTFLR